MLAPLKSRLFRLPSGSSRRGHNWSATVRHPPLPASVGFIPAGPQLVRYRAHPPLPASVGFIPAGPQLVRYRRTMTHRRVELPDVSIDAGTRSRPTRAAACFGLGRAHPCDSSTTGWHPSPVAGQSSVRRDEPDAAAAASGAEMGLSLSCASPHAHPAPGCSICRYVLPSHSQSLTGHRIVECA